MNIVLLSSLLFAVFGPTVNPETQYRAFWGMQYVVADRCADAGFNLLMSAKDPHESGEFARWLPLCRKRGVDFMPMMLKFQKNADSEGLRLADRFPRVGPDGKPIKGAGADAALAADFVRSRAERFAAEYARRYGEHREIAGFMTSSEVRDNARPSFTPALTSAWLRAGGKLPVPVVLGNRWGVNWRTAPGFPADGVVADDDPWLSFYRWYWREGDGWNRYQDILAKALGNAFDRPIVTYYDPDMRVPPLYGSGGNVSHTGTWVYPYPEPALVDYIVSEQQAMARGNPGRGIITGIQGITYRSKVAPAQVKVANPPAWLADHPDAVYITTPPDMLREAFWFLFARRLDGMDTHGQNSVFGPRSYKGGYRFTHDGLEKTFADLFLGVAEPLGPLFKALPERPPEVAVLESFSSVVFGGRHSYGWGSDDGTMLTLAGLSPQVLYDEEIMTRGIPPSLKVLFVHGCEALARGVWLRVREFQERGGVLVGSAKTLPALMPDLEIPRFVRTGRLADDHAALRKAAAEIRAALAPYVVPPASSDRADIVVRTRSYGATDYVFAINDRRTAGDYVGQWGLVYEKGLPNAGRVTVNRVAGAVYDLVANRAVPFFVVGERTAVNVSYQTNDGRLLAFVDRPLSPLSAAWAGGRLRVTSPDRHVMIPVELLAEGGRPYYGVVADGEFRPLAFDPGKASAVRIRNLMDGTVTTCAVSRERAEDPVSRRALFRRKLSDPALRAETVRLGLASDDPVIRRAACYARDGGRKTRSFTFYRKNIALSQDASNDHSVSLVSKIDLPKSGWLFLTDPDDALFTGPKALFSSPDGWKKARKIGIGCAWEEQGVHGYDGVAWYRLTFKLPESPSVCDSLELCFDGVDEEAWVWLNGAYIGQHAEGPSGYKHPFRFGVTQEARWGGENVIVVRVRDTKGHGGIWKGVRLEMMKNAK